MLQDQAIVVEVLIFLSVRVQVLYFPSRDALRCSMWPPVGEADGPAI
jgi:hypothetical protein